MRSFRLTDTQGNQVQYLYDTMGRVTRIRDHTATNTDHTYDGPGRLRRRHRRVNFNRLIKTDATVGVNTTNYEHTYAGKKHLGNIDVTNQQQPVNGKVWRWEGGAGTPSADPIECPQRSGYTSPL